MTFSEFLSQHSDLVGKLEQALYQNHQKAQAYADHIRSCQDCRPNQEGIPQGDCVVRESLLVDYQESSEQYLDYFNQIRGKSEGKA